jgi:hypothetical protein
MYDYPFLFFETLLVLSVSFLAKTCYNIYVIDTMEDRHNEHQSYY